MRYQVYVPGFVDIGTFDNLRELRKGLADGGCMKHFTIDEFEEMVESLNGSGVWSHKMTDDPRLNFHVKVI